MMDYQKVYTEMHDMEYFSGGVLKRYVDDITELIESHGPRNILDYGCGKGYQYLKLRVHERWGGLLPHCYDVGVRQLAYRPEIKFDGVICTDLMEHIEEPDVDEILDDIFGYVTDEKRRTFLFFSISCCLGGKSLPDGRNVHLTVRPPDWWTNALERAKERCGLKRSTIAVCFEMEDRSVIKKEI